MKMILFNQNPMITKLLESVSKKLELSVENFNHYQELSTRLKEDPEWILIADDECLEKLDQVDWLELKEIISQNKNGVCMYKKGNEAQPFLEGFEMKIKKPFLPTEVLKILQKKLGSNINELEPSQNLDPTQEVLETNWDELENLGDLEALVQEESNNEEQLLPTLNAQEEKEEVKEEVKETPQEEEKPKEEIQEDETLKSEEVSKELETQEEVKEETQEIKEEKQEKTQDSPSTQELEAMQELVKEIQENSNEDKKETQESTETPQEAPQDVENQAQEIQDKEIQETQEIQENTETPQDVETPQEKETPQTQEKETQEKETQEKETQEKETQEKETQESTETPQELEIPQAQEKETPQEETQEKETPKDESMQESAQNLQDKETPQEKETQEDHYESIEDIPEPVMAKAMGEELPFLNESVAKTPNNENDTETPKESVIKTPQEKEGSDKTSSPLELRLNLQDLLKSLNQESLKSLLENKTLSIKITLEDKKPDA